MAKVFKKDLVVQEKQIIEIIRDTLDVDADGIVRFKSRTGRGCGKGIEIPSDQFDEFVNMMVETQKKRTSRANEQRELDKIGAEAGIEVTSEIAKGE